MRRCPPPFPHLPTLEITQGQIDGFFSQLPYKSHLEEVVSAGDWHKNCPQPDSRAEESLDAPLEDGAEEASNVEHAEWPGGIAEGEGASVVDSPSTKRCAK